MQAQYTLRKALKGNNQITEAAIAHALSVKPTYVSPRFVSTLHFSHLTWGEPRSNPAPKEGRTNLEWT